MVSAVIPTHTTPIRNPATYDRVFYSGMAAALAVTVFGGFASSYYLPLFMGGPRTTFSGGAFNLLVHLHGALFTAWVVLFVVQTSLVARHRVALHRRLGVIGAALAATMVVAGTALAVTTAARGGAPPGVDPLAFFAIPVFDMILFATFVMAALALRRNKEAHKRLMLLAYISIMVAAVARLAIGPAGLIGSFGITFLFIAAAATYDAISRRRIHPVYLWGGAAFAVSVPLRLFVSGTGAWRAFAEAVTR